MEAKRKRKIKFLTIYQSFTETEKIEFSNFLKSDLIGRKRNYDQILSLIKVNAKGYLEIAGTKSQITRWNRLSELHLLAEKFLVLKSINQNSFIYKVLLLKEYDRRDLVNSFEQIYKTITGKISNEQIFNYDYTLINELDKMHLNHLDAISDTKKFLNKLNETNNFRTGMYLADLLEQLIKLSNRNSYGLLSSKILDENIYSSLDFEMLLSFFSKATDSSNKLYFILKFLYLIYLSYSDLHDKTNYIEAKKIFIKQLKYISLKQRSDFFFYMIDYNIKKLNFGIPGALEELFYLMDKKLKEEIFIKLKTKELHPYEFRDYIFVGLMLKKYNWLNKYLKKYAVFLPSDIKADYLLLSKAMISMDKKEFLLCKELLMKIKRRNVLIFVDSSVLKLKVLFELKEFDECQNELKKFNEYLGRERIVNTLLVRYAKDFCRAYALLLKFTHKPSSVSLNNLQFKLSQKTFIAKKWITLKAEEVNLKTS